MIDRIIRKNYNEYWIIYTNRKPLIVSSSGNAFALIDWALYGKNYLA